MTLDKTSGRRIRQNIIGYDDRQSLDHFVGMVPKSGELVVNVCSNTNQVSSGQAPTSIEDLLQPKWKGKLGMDKDAADWLAAVMDFYGDDRGKQIARGVAWEHRTCRLGKAGHWFCSSCR